VSRVSREKPVIGLSLGLLDFGNYAGVGHQRPVALAGGVPFVLPRLDGGTMNDALDACDGVLLGGGRDIEPARYGQEPHELLTATDPQAARCTRTSRSTPSPPSTRPTGDGSAGRRSSARRSTASPTCPSIHAIG
jgi:hypothetical protein